jgi:hypothetical protein
MFITVTTVGSTIATGAASTSIAIPPASSGEVPRFIRLSSTNGVHAKLGTSDVEATDDDMLINVSDALVINVPRGVTHIAAIQESAAGKLNVVPLEDC